MPKGASETAVAVKEPRKTWRRCADKRVNISTKIAYDSAKKKEEMAETHKTSKNVWENKDKIMMVTIMAMMMAM